MPVSMKQNTLPSYWRDRRLSWTINVKFSTTVSASKWAVEPAFEMGMLVVSPTTKTLSDPSRNRVLGLVGIQPILPSPESSMT